LEFCSCFRRYAVPVTFSGEKRDLFLGTFLAILCHFPDSALSTEEWLLSLVTLQPQNQGLQGDGTPLSAPEPPEALQKPHESDAGTTLNALGAVAGLRRRYPELTVVWRDAHGDFNTPAITISGYLGGMALAMLTGRAPGLFGETLGLRPVADTDIVLANNRDLDPAERDALAASQMGRVPADPAAITSALSKLGRPRRSTCTSTLTSSTARNCPACASPQAPDPPSPRSRNASPPSAPPPT
jgi:Arginase family